MKKILILLLFITGCSKYTDLSDLAIIKSIGIKYQDKYTLYALIYDDVKKDNIPQTKVIETSGKNISELFNNLNVSANKEIFLSHIDLLLLDEELKDINYQEIINYFINHNELRNDFLCVFSKNIKSILDNTKHNEIEDFIKANNRSKKTINISFDEVINTYLNNESFSLSMIAYDKEMQYLGNYLYHNNRIEMIKNDQEN